MKDYLANSKHSNVSWLSNATVILFQVEYMNDSVVS